jgi:hypothetical protein
MTLAHFGLSVHNSRYVIDNSLIEYKPTVFLCQWKCQSLSLCNAYSYNEGTGECRMVNALVNGTIEVATGCDVFLFKSV